jgi:hypothetical protein
MAFKLNLSPELRARVEAESREIERLFGLEDRWLAAELLRLARTIRERTQYGARSGEHDTYNSALLWDVIPEVAYRLGGRLMLNEATDYDLKVAQGVDFRNHVAIYLKNVATCYFRDADRGEQLEPVAILFREAWNGNPIVMALDRITPPDLEAADILAQDMVSMARTRGHVPTGRWHPSMQKKPETTGDWELT